MKMQKARTFRSDMRNNKKFAIAEKRVTKTKQILKDILRKQNKTSLRKVFKESVFKTTQLISDSPKCFRRKHEKFSY